MPDAGAQSMLGGWALRNNGPWDRAAQQHNAVCFGFTVGDNITHHGTAAGGVQGYYNVAFVTVQLCAMTWLLWMVISNDRRARRGDYKASKRLILPVYKRIVYVMCFCQLLSSAFVAMRLLGKYLEGNGGNCQRQLPTATAPGRTSSPSWSA